LEYAKLATRPVLPGLLVIEPTLKSVFAGIGSAVTKVVAIRVELSVPPEEEILV